MGIDAYIECGKCGARGPVFISEDWLVPVHDESDKRDRLVRHDHRQKKQAYELWSNSAAPVEPGPNRKPWDFARVVCLAFNLVREHGYSVLQCGATELIDADPEFVREQLDAAIGEVASMLELENDVETRGELADIVLDTETALNEYLIETTDR